MPDNLKKGCARVAFGDVVQLCRERSGDPAADGFERYVGLDHLEPGNLKIRRWGNAADGTTFTNVFRAGQVLFGKRRAYQRKVAVADFDGICSGDIYVFEPKNDKLLPELLPFICQTDGFFDHAVGTSAGSLSPRTNWDSLASYEFPLPPIEEQRRIAEVLEAYRQLSESTGSLLNSSRTVHNALRASLFGTKDIIRADSGEGGKSRPGWSATTIGSVAEFLDGRRIPLKDADRALRRGPYPYYGASGVIDHIDGFLFDEELLLISEDGANLLDRSTPIAFLATGQYWVNNHAHVLRAVPPYTNLLLAEYVEGLTLEPYVTGTAQPKLNKAACESIPIPRPPDSELASIEKQLRLSVEVVHACEKRASELASLVQVMLSGLMTSETMDAL